MENKVVLVTGSARGIGKATIIEFASKGYNVVINYIESKEEANKLKEYVESNFNIKALVIEADVSNENAVKNMIDNRYCNSRTYIMRVVSDLCNNLAEMTQRERNYFFKRSDEEEK